MIPGLVVEGIDDGDVGIYLDGLAVEIGRAIAPLADGIERGWVEQWVAREDFERLDRAVGGDDGVEFDVGLVTKNDAESRKCRLDAVDQESRFDVTHRNAGWFVRIFPAIFNDELGPIVGRRERVAIGNAGWPAHIGTSIRRFVRA